MYTRQGRLRSAVAATGICALTIVGVASAGGGYALRNGTLASAGDVVTNNCFTLSSTVGEPVAGSASNGSLTVTSGFQAVVAARQQTIISDRIFQNGFDAQQGNCTP